MRGIWVSRVNRLSGRAFYSLIDNVRAELEEELEDPKMGATLQELCNLNHTFIGEEMRLI